LDDVSPNKFHLGTVVALKGEYLLMGGKTLVSIKLGGVEVEKIVSASDRMLVVVAGDRATPGNVDIALTSDTDARMVIQHDVEYLAQGKVKAVTPAYGQKGTGVSITGSLLLGGGIKAARVMFGAVTTTVESSSNTEINITDVGGGVVGAKVDITIHADTGARVTQADGWTQSAQGVISRVAPKSGQQGTLVTIVGEHMLSGGSVLQSVTLGGVEAQKIVKGDDNDMVIVIADTSTAGRGAITLTAETGAFITLADSWTYIEQGAVGSVTPASGQEGTVVVVNGTNLLGGGANFHC